MRSLENSAFLVIPRNIGIVYVPTFFIGKTLYNYIYYRSSCMHDDSNSKDCNLVGVVMVDYERTHITVLQN